MYGFYRVAAATPQVDVADVEFHKKEILRLYQQSCVKGTAAVAFPELQHCIQSTLFQTTV